MDYVTRSEWGARPPKYIVPFPSANKPVAVGYEHHTVTAFRPALTIMRQVQNFHMDTRGWSDIAYSWLVDDDGIAYEGRGWNRAGGHTAGQNSVSFAVCHIGDYSTKAASSMALDTAAALWRWGIDIGAVSPAFALKGHREAPGAYTQCPGNALFAQLPDLRSRVVPKPVTLLEEDMRPIIWNVLDGGGLFFELAGVCTHIVTPADFYALVDAYKLTITPVLIIVASAKFVADRMAV